MEDYQENCVWNVQCSCGLITKIKILRAIGLAEKWQMSWTAYEESLSKELEGKEKNINQ